MPKDQFQASQCWHLYIPRLWERQLNESHALQSQMKQEAFGDGPQDHCPVRQINEIKPAFLPVGPEVCQLVAKKEGSGKKSENHKSGRIHPAGSKHLRPRH
mmetsp:Transcript_61345/g.75216  ORF Transcript_61345/g.75216 Transcript_61345/m.75216 type:complete len:101 (+) Transcript_61345:804-1106(+)